VQEQGVDWAWLRQGLRRVGGGRGAMAMVVVSLWVSVRLSMGAGSISVEATVGGSKVEVMMARDVVVSARWASFEEDRFEMGV
jgi:hypothetical protein